MAAKIGTAEFKNRLAVLCLRGGGGGFPRKQRDQYILFKSIILMLAAEQDYTETELNEALTMWLSQVGRTVAVDYVSLRRYLVDAGFVTRDRAGRSYRVNREQTAGLFETDIEEINPVVVVDEAYRAAEERKQTYLKKQESDRRKLR